MSSQKTVPNGIKFLIGGTSGMAATCFVQPLDLIKNRMQLSGTKTSTISVTSSILKNEGILALYSGLSAGLMRQATYTTTRLGIYTWLIELTSKDAQPSFIVKALLGMTAGCVGAFVGTPAEVALIRMTADGRLPIGYFEENIVLHFASSMISGLVTTAASMPVDIAKTRIQNMKTINGKPEFTGAFDVLTKVIRNEGLFALWKGFFPYYARLGPHTVLTFIFLEQMTSAYKTYL
ncbi:Mitochondrial 2-oxoglutarate/malate carrier protein [Harpegnathos saltator]|uniref:Mitochondrial 2-oxoglutarate/malate carrier protein n=1 Tax=Harpegnathos saltator TaxID=610380 RepID=E2B6G1_HARSA|nr:Mitochondrial 2-oxoglutarate/malate carrier protein [Harpegnathos saltator]